MLNDILNGDKAINMHIAIMRAFAEIRKVLLQKNDLKKQLGEHNVQRNRIYNAMEDLSDEKAAQRKWDERERTGFKK